MVSSDEIKQWVDGETLTPAVRAQLEHAVLMGLLDDTIYIDRQPNGDAIIVERKPAHRGGTN